MAGKQFLNPFLKLVLCVFGTSLIGFYVYESVISGANHDATFFVRILVLLGFIYLLFQSAREIISK
jgi:ABC-type Fe3+ transport system permease subunit